MSVHCFLGSSRITRACHYLRLDAPRPHSQEVQVQAIHCTHHKCVQDILLMTQLCLTRISCISDKQHLSCILLLSMKPG